MTMAEGPVTLRPETAISYLERRGVFDPSEKDAVSANALGGGVSNRVIRVDGRSRCLVLKQPLGNLAVAEDWPADVSRVHNEAAAARAYAAVAREANGSERRDQEGWSVSVPEIVFEDERHHVVAMECAPDGAMSWKSELLDGSVDVEVARALGRFLGVAHRSAAGDADLEDRFGNVRPFEQLRIEPYHRTTAARHPDLADAILAETERVLGVRETLVHGDYSPKNVLVDRGGMESGDADDPTPTLWLLDFEVAHWGDPAFDTGFMLNHLFIKSVHNRAQTNEYLDAARAFWRAYDEAVGWDTECETVRELAVLMLARVDGKSPVEYIDEPTGEVLREIARRALTSEIATIGEYASLTREVSE